MFLAVRGVCGTPGRRQPGSERGGAAASSMAAVGRAAWRAAPGRAAWRGRGCLSATDTEEAARWHHAFQCGAEMSGRNLVTQESQHIYSPSVVSFPTRWEAEIARESLALDAEPHQEATGKESGRDGRHAGCPLDRLEILAPVRVSKIRFVEQLSLLVRTLRPPGFPLRQMKQFLPYAFQIVHLAGGHSSPRQLDALAFI